MNRNNNLGFLRLLLASLVILSHSPELIDGNRSRELLTILFGTLSFGELAVDGFFVISGYLITGSYESSKSVVDYLTKRVFRIYPGFVVAFLISMVVGVVWANGSAESLLTLKGILRQLREMVLLAGPELPGAFDGLPYPALNGSMWTISYEFRCYLLVIVLGWAGLHRVQYVYLCMALVIVGANSIAFHPDFDLLAGYVGSGLANKFSGVWSNHLRLIGAFAIGASYYLFKDKVAFRRDWAAVAVIALSVLMFSRQFSEAALLILGGYLLFYVAFGVNSKVLSGIGQKVDLSYGVYLYAWPIQSLIIYAKNDISPWLLFILSLVGSMVAGYLSWTLVESPAMKVGKAWARQRVSRRAISRGI